MAQASCTEFTLPTWLLGEFSSLKSVNEESIIHYTLDFWPDKQRRNQVWLGKKLYRVLLSNLYTVSCLQAGCSALFTSSKKSVFFLNDLPISYVQNLQKIMISYAVLCCSKCCKKCPPTVQFLSDCKGGLISVTIFIFGPMPSFKKMCKITILNFSVSSGKFEVFYLCILKIPYEINPISPGKDTFYHRNSKSHYKARVERVKPFLFFL